MEPRAADHPAAHARAQALGEPVPLFTVGGLGYLFLHLTAGSTFEYGLPLCRPPHPRALRKHLLAALAVARRAPLLTFAAVIGNKIRSLGPSKNNQTRGGAM